MTLASKPLPARIARPRGFDLLVVAALVFYFLLARFFPGVFERWPLQMHYAWHDKHIFSHGAASLVPLFASIALVLTLAIRLRRTGRWVAAGLFVTALALQWSLSFLDDGLSARRISSTLLAPEYGHSEFPVLAFGERSPIELAREYEIRCITDPRFVYARTKPPGQFVFYTLAAHAYRDFAPADFFESLARRAGFYDCGPLSGYGAFTTILFSVISCLAILVIAALGRGAGGRRVGAWAALAWTLCPAAALVTMHLDQVLYPLLAASALVCAMAALTRSPVYAMAAGLAIGLALYVSFSLVFLIPTVLLIWGCQSVGRFRRKRHGNVTSGGSDLLTWCVLLGVGLLAGWAFLRLALNFNLPVAWRRSMFFHIRWRHTTGLVGLQDTLRNFVEFAIWMGLPAVMVYGKVMARGVRKMMGRMGPMGMIRPWEMFAVIYPVLVLGISVFGHTTAEIGRLWLPLMLPIMIVVGRELAAMYRRRPWVYVVMGLAMMLLVKNFHDF